MSYLSEQDIDSPLSRWQFEETSGTTIDDDKTATRDGTINGTVTLNQANQFTDGGLGADFNGSNGYVSIGNSSGLLGIGTVEVVALFDTIPASNPNPLFTHAYSSGQIIPLVIGFNLDAANAGKLQVGYFTGSVWQTATWTTAPQTGTPYHIVGKYDGTTLKLRVNGTEVATATPGTARPGSGTVNATAYIGRRWDSGQYHDGKIWDVAIYASALSDARLDAHFLALANPFADNFANAGVAMNNTQLNGLDITSWTLEGGEPGSVSHTGWATFTPTTTTIHRINTIGSDFDTVLNVYTGTILTGLTLVANDDDSGGSGTSELEISLTSGTTYYIQVGAQPAGSGGLLGFSISSLSNARLAAITGEALSNGTPERRLAGVSAEVMTDGDSIPARRLSSLSYEAAVEQVPPDRQLSAISYEVLVPARLQYVGWGTPIKTPTWL